MSAETDHTDYNHLQICGGGGGGRGGCAFHLKASIMLKRPSHVFNCTQTCALQLKNTTDRLSCGRWLVEGANRFVGLGA